MHVKSEFLTSNSERKFIEQLRVLSYAGSGVIHVRTGEALRCAEAIRAHLLVDGDKIHEWNANSGFIDYTVDNMLIPSVDGDSCISILEAIRRPKDYVIDRASEEQDKESMRYFVFMHPHYWIEGNPQLTHFLLFYSRVLSQTKTRLILITPDTPLPESLESSIISIHFDTPSYEEFMESLSGILESVDDSLWDIDENDKKTVCFAGAGMSRLNFETFVSVAIIEANQKDELVTVQHLLRGVAKGKTEIVNSSEVLELYPTEGMENVGGLDLIKAWVKERKECFTDKAEDFGITPPKGVVAVGIPGCLSGDTLIDVEIKSCGFVHRCRLHLDFLYYLLNNRCEDALQLRLLTKEGQRVNTTNPIKACSLSEDSGHIIANTIEGVVSSGRKLVYEVTAKYCGRIYSIKATMDHKFFTKKGYVPLKELAVGDMLYTTIISSSTNRIAYIAQIHSINCIGEEDTYDIQMAAPHHNFVANGFIVHNSGKSLFAKAVAKEFGVPLIRLDFGRVFHSYIGSSENRMRSALRQIESMAPVCVLADEIDKGLGGIGGSGDSGTSSRVFGTFLTWLQENKNPVFVVVTANNIANLPPELTRKGRFDEIFGVGFPNREARLEVLTIHLRKRGYDINDFTDDDLVKFCNASLGFVPAEIEQAVNTGLIRAFNDEETDGLTMDHMIGALEDTIPIAKAYGTEIQAMILWMQSHTTPASKDDVSMEDIEKGKESGNVISLSKTRKLTTRRRKKDKGEE